MKGYTRNTGQRSQCTVTAQAVARARIDHRSVECSICVTCTAYAPRMCGCKPQVQTTIHVPCSCLRVCEYHTFQPSQQTLRHSRAATENFKRHRVRKLQVQYGAMDSLLLKLQRQHDLQISMRDLRTGQPRDKRFFRGVSLGHLG